MKTKTQKSVQDFNGWTLSKNNQNNVKGGNDVVVATTDFIITDDFMDG